jgi:colanic acid biosynthesis glycosyl transferase WcaI
LSSVAFKPYQPREHLAESLSVADVHLVSLIPALEGCIVPSKFYGIAAAGRGTIFIGDRKGEIARILEETRSGITVEQGASRELAAVVMALASDRQRIWEMGRNARHALEARFDVTRSLQSWEDVLTTVTKPVEAKERLEKGQTSVVPIPHPHSPQPLRPERSQPPDRP